MNKFNVKEITERLIEWIKNWFIENGPDCNAVIGISGGKDSTIVAKLLVEALGNDRVIGVLMPNGIQSDIKDSRKVCEVLNIKSIEVDISSAMIDIVESIKYGIYDNVRQGTDDYLKMSEQSIINLAPRVRMTTLYAISQSMNGRVVNTCNLSEDWVGYSTKYGDGAGDFSPLANLTVTEILQIGDYLGLPYELVHKVPSDGLCGKTDEDNLGFTYDELDKYIREGIEPEPKKKEKIDRLYKMNLFKLLPMPSFIP